MGSTFLGNTDRAISQNFLIIVCLMDAIAVMVLILRTGTSLKIFRKLFVSDLLMLLAGAFVIISWALLVACFIEGFHDPHTTSLTSLPVSLQDKMFDQVNFSGVFALIASLFARTSFAVYMLRLATERWVKYTLYSCIALTAIGNILMLIYSGIACQRHDGYGEAAKCWQNNTSIRLNFMRGAVNAFVDLVLMALPAYMIYKVRITWRLKLCVAMVLCLSFLAAASSLLIIGEFAQLYNRPLTTIATARIVLCYMAEMNIIIITASIPAIRPWFTARSREKSSNYDTEKLNGGYRSVTPQSRYITSWTGYNACPFTIPGQVDARLGNCITIEGGHREDKHFHNHWYRKEKELERIDVTSTRSTF